MRVALFQFLLFIVFSNSIQGQHFAGGDGSDGNPWQIMTPSHLDSVRHFSGDHFILMNDIDLSFDTGHPDGKFWNNGAGWQPIGFFGEHFVVHFNGNGFKIHGLTIGDGFPDGSGLFGTIDNSTIRNLGVTKIDIRVQNFGSRVGAIAAFSDRSTIDQVFASGTISNASDAGGLVGINQGSISNSYADVDILNPLGLTGGLVGDNSFGTISRSYSIGFVESSSFFVNRNYAVTGSGNTEFSYYNGETVGPSTNSTKGIWLNTKDLTATSLIESLDFTDSGAWTIQQDTTYPYLKWQNEPDSINYPTRMPNTGGVSARSRSYGATIGWLKVSTEQPIGFNIYRWGNRLNEELITEEFYLDSSAVLGDEYAYQVTSLYEFDGDTVETGMSEFDKVRAGFFGGKGEEFDPYRLSDIEQFKFIDRVPDGYFSLNIDINASTTKNWNDGKGFKPIQNFTGSFDGMGYAIDSLYINRPDQDSVGLFDITTGNVIDLGLTNVEIIGRDNVGSIAGFNDQLVERIYVTGSVSGINNVGGISGSGFGVISNSYTDVIVQAENAAGGLIGFANNVEYNFNYTVGSVSSNGTAGPIIGEGQVDINAWNYWNSSNNLDGYTNNLGRPLELTEMRQQSNFEDFDFENTWEIIEGFSFPFLMSNQQKPLPGFISPFSSGDGSILNPFQITSNQELNTVRFLLNDHFILMNDLDITLDTQTADGAFWNSGKGWTPIGNRDNMFQGTFDGNGFKITGIKINHDADFHGFFSFIGQHGVVQNITLDSLSVRGVNLVGGLVSQNYGHISQVKIQGEIIGQGMSGGIAGVNKEGAIIEESISSGSVRSQYFNAGGLVGDNRGDISNSYSTAKVRNSQFIGANGNVGGLIGQGFNGNLSNSFHKGELTSSRSVGGIVGNNIGTTFESVYWDSTASGTEYGAGDGIFNGTFALSSVQMRDQNSFENWDFETVWVLQPNAEYPTLQWDPIEFEIPIPDPVTLISPIQDEYFVIFEAKFIWSSSTNADSYSYELAADSLFQEIVFTTEIADTVLNLQNGILQGGVEYFWRVQAKNESGESSWSDVFYFTGNEGLSTESNSGIPDVFALSQNYPNPFNPSTNIKFDLPESAEVLLIVYDMLGREVSRLISDKMTAGYHQVTFDASLLASGMYIYRITAGNYTSTKKMLLIK